MAKELPVVGGSCTLVDDADFERFSETRIYRNPDGAIKVWRHNSKGQYSSTALARLILDARPGLVVHHINGDKSDNRRENLEEVTHKEHAQRHPERSSGRRRMYDNPAEKQRAYRARKRAEWLARQQADSEKPDLDSDVLTIDEAAAMLGVAPRTLRRWLKTKDVPFVRINREIRFLRGSLISWLKKQEQQGE